MKQYALRPQSATSGSGDLLVSLLRHRGIETPEDVEYFLNPSYDKHVHDPFLLHDMDRAVERILKAIAGEEKTVIYSDYDTDGIPGAVVLHDFFKKVGFKNFINYIPHRHDEGFGLNSDAVEQFIKDGVRLLITIDCGINDIVPIREAKKGGIDVIVTDHHLPPEKLPPAFAIVNPKHPKCDYPEKMLCGAGVIFKLVQALVKKGNEMKAFTNHPDGIIKEGWEKWLLDMVGIATLSDMVPLRGENRAFAYFGLMVLRKSPRVGIARLLNELGVDQRYLTEEDIGFTIGPRINAASRMGVPMDAFHMLATDDVNLAREHVEHLNHINDERKGTVAAMAKEIKKVIKERWGVKSDGQAGSDSSDSKVMPRVIVLGNPDWRPSLVGLVANTIAEEYRRPAYIWGRDGEGIIKGSCRSDGETDLVALMQSAEDSSPKTFIQFGGHAFSGGFSVKNDKIHTLGDKLNAAFDKLAREERVAPAIDVDREMLLDDVNWDTHRVIDRLAPFGTGNPKPLFMFRNIVPSSVRGFGKEKNHLEMLFSNSRGMPVKAIAFFKTAEDWMSGYGETVIARKPLTLIATFEKSVFRGKTELRLRIVDIIKK